MTARGWAAIVVVALAGAPPTLARATETEEILDVPVAFEVSNTNTSRVPCISDGAAYTVRGHLVGPRSRLEGAESRTATLYLHDLGLGEWLWRFSALPGLDFAIEMAKAGHTSVTIDELGHDSSDRPEGYGVCLGSHADVVHQIVDRLRSGDYSAAGAAPPSFSEIVLAGHSGGAQIAQIAAYSFKGIAGLAIFGWSDLGASQRTQNEFMKAGLVCATGGQRADGDSGPRGYAYFGQTDEDFRRSFFNPANVDADVAAAATSLRNRIPCGDFASVLPGIAVDQASLREIAVPVLLVFGEMDATFPPEGEPGQRESFGGSSDVDSVILERAGHAFTLERTAPTFRATVASWLADHGLVTAAPTPVAEEEREPDRRRGEDTASRGERRAAPQTRGRQVNDEGTGTAGDRPGTTADDGGDRPADGSTASLARSSAAASGGRLPFSGLPLAPFAAAATILVVAGIALRSCVRVTE